MSDWSRSATPGVDLVNSAAQADVIIETNGAPSLSDRWPFGTGKTNYFGSRPECTFVWDAGDLPTNRLPGLYASATRRMHDLARHRPFCYPFKWNEHIRQAAPSEANVSFGFFGSRTAPLRARIFELFATRLPTDRALVRETQSLWGHMFDPKSRGEKELYAEAIARCRFVLCPKGNGVGSVRLFEVMESGRVPIVLSDRFLLPAGIDWAGCSIRVPERELHRIPEIVQSREGEWLQMAARARRVWEEHFSDQTMLGSIAREIREILASRKSSERLRGVSAAVRLIPFVLESRAKHGGVR